MRSHRQERFSFVNVCPWRWWPEPATPPSRSPSSQFLEFPGGASQGMYRCPLAPPTQLIMQMPVMKQCAAPEPRPWLNRERPWLSSRCPTCTMSPGGHGSTDGLSARTKRGDSLCHLYSCTRPAPRWAPGCHLVLFTYVFTFGCAASSPCTGSSAVAVGGGYSLAVTCRLLTAMAFLVEHRL